MHSKHLDNLMREVFGSPKGASGQGLTISDSAAHSSALTAGTRVRIEGDVDCWMSFFTDGVTNAAANTSMLKMAGCPEVFDVPEGYLYVSCIKKDTNDPNGVLSIIVLEGHQVP